MRINIDICGFITSVALIIALFGTIHAIVFGAITENAVLLNSGLVAITIVFSIMTFLYNLNDDEITSCGMACWASLTSIILFSSLVGSIYMIVFGAVNDNNTIIHGGFLITYASIIICAGLVLSSYIDEPKPHHPHCVHHI